MRVGITPIGASAAPALLAANVLPISAISAIRPALSQAASASAPLSAPASAAAAAGPVAAGEAAAGAAAVVPAEAASVRDSRIPGSTAKAEAGRRFDGNGLAAGAAEVEPPVEEPAAAAGSGTQARLRPLFPKAEAYFAAAPAWRAAHPDAKVLTFIRHGESLSNVFQYVQTYDSFSPLTRLGNRQREALLRFLGERRIVFDRYVASDLERAFRTLEPLASAAAKSLQILKRFREALIHPIGGTPTKLSRHYFPDRLERFVRDPEDYRVGGLYSGRKVKESLRGFLDELEASGPRSTVVGSHGMTILLGIMEALDIPWKNYSEVFGTLGNPPNVSLTVLAYDPRDGRWRLLVAPDNSYLPAALRTRTAGRTARLAELGRYYGLAVARLATAPLRFLRGGPPLRDYEPSWTTFFRPGRRKLERMVRAFDADGDEAPPARPAR